MRRFFPRLLSLLLLLWPALGLAGARVVKVKDLGRLLLTGGKDAHSSTDAYLSAVERQGMFERQRGALGAWAATVRRSRPAAGLRRTGKKVFGILLNEAEDLVGDSERKSHRRSFERAIRQAHGTPVFLPPGVGLEALDHIDHLVIGGGDDTDPRSYGQAVAGAKPTDPARDLAQAKLIEEALRRKMNVTGICLGMQRLNIALGGTLIQDLPSVGIVGHGEGRHPVRFAPDSFTARELGVLRLRAVPTWHHEAIDRLGEDLRVAAWAPDGTVEAVESADGRARGYQFHPELSRSPAVRSIWRTVVERP